MQTSILLAKRALCIFNLCIYLVHATLKWHLIKTGTFLLKTLAEKNIRSRDVLNGLNSALLVLILIAYFLVRVQFVSDLLNLIYALQQVLFLEAEKRSIK